MASLYKRTEKGCTSPFWWINYRDPISGIVKRESTGYRIGVGQDTRRAKEMEARKTLEESRFNCNSRAELWEVWVRTFLDSRYRPNPTTNPTVASSGSWIRYCTAWRTIRLFLEEKGIALPRQLSRAHCESYSAWRKKPDKQNGKYRAGQGTAITELKFLGLLMEEAIMRGYATFNPCRKLGLKRRTEKVKPELTEEQLKKITEAIPHEPEPRRTFFHGSFQLARYHGVRLNETNINPQTDVELWRDGKRTTGIIRFTVKGGKAHSVAIHPKLVDWLKKLKDGGVTGVYALPKSPAKEWFNFLTRLGIKKESPNACFHSLRVTVASLMARNDVPLRKAMQYIAHGSTTVHAAYVRWRPEDVAECHDAV